VADPQKKNKPKGLKKSWKNHEKVMKAGHFLREYGLGSGRGYRGYQMVGEQHVSAQTAYTRSPQK
jgi:hypothetical protein